MLDGDDAMLKDVAERSAYVVDHRAKAQALKPAIEALRTLGVEVRTAGRNDWEARTEGVHIVFLDWFFGTDGQQEAVDRASAAARKIHGLPEKPLVVLISSNPTVKEEASVFRKVSGLMPGLFDAMPKSWLSEEFRLHLQMTALAEIFQKGHVVQAFVDNVNDSVAGAVVTFKDAIQSLTLSDYANLQDLALRADGHPLGDYLTEMLSGLWCDTLFRGALKTNIRALNREDFSGLPTSDLPSPVIGRIFNSAVFDMHVGDFEHHPHYGDGKEQETRRLQLSLGDIIVEEAEGKPTKVHVVMNPECDLASSPRGVRRIPDDQSILLLPGDLVAVDHVDRTKRKNLPDTPYFTFDEGSMFRIHWNITSMRSVPFGKFEEWLQNKKRRARMRSLHVLSLQQAVHAHLTRVGIPSSPPIYQPLTATLRTISARKFIGEGRGLPQGRYVLPRDSEGDKIAFSKEFVVELTDAVVLGLEDLKLPENRTRDKEGVIAEIRNSLLDPTSLGELLLPFKLNKYGRKFLGDSVWVCREDKAPTEQQLSAKNLVCILLK